MDRKDEQSKQFTVKALTVVGATAGAVLIAAVAFAGGRGKLDA